MAAKTPDSILSESWGSLRLYIATFSTNDIDNGDTWASAIPGIVGYWGCLNDDGTQEKEGLAIALSGTTLTFKVGEANRTGIVYVLQKP